MPALLDTGAALLRPLLVLLAVVVLLLGLLWTGQRSLIYLPDASGVAAADTWFPDARDLRLRAADGVELGAYLVPATEPDRGLTVLVANGNAGNRESRVPFATVLREAGFSVLLFDYRGYGGNDGRPTEEGLALDARAALAALTGPLGVAPESVLYYGESLGTGVVTELAVEHPPAGLVLRSPFPDLPALGRVHYPYLPVRALLWDRYPTAERVAALEVPTTVVYGTADTVVPPEQSREVAAAAGTLFEEVAVPDANHNDPVMFTGPELVAAIERLADHVTG